METLVFILLPLVVSMLLIAILRGRVRSNWIAISMVFIAFLISLLLLIYGYHGQEIFSWFTFGAYTFSLSLIGDGLSLLMATFVSLISLLVLIFSRFYMQHEKQERYYFEMSLFMFSMLGLVLSSSLLSFYIFWELISLSSYLLINFWYKNSKASLAARKAFVFTRIGDISLLAAIIILFVSLNTLSIPMILGNIGKLSPNLLIVVSSLLLIAAFSKSAQFPFYTWLPDAMEAPTTVSALLHSATMVAAGAFLVILMGNLILSAGMSVIIAIFSFLTIFIAIILALKEVDAKRILAYSTIESLSFMFLAVSTYNPNGALFYLFSHGIFKTSLFLIVAMLVTFFGTRDIYRLKTIGVRNYKTFLPALIGVLSLSAIPPFIGFFGHSALSYNFNLLDNLLFALISYLTALFAFRFLFVIYRNQVKRPLKFTTSSSITLITLAVLMTVGGFSIFFMQGILSVPYTFDLFLIIDIIASLLGILTAYILYYIYQLRFNLAWIKRTFHGLTFDNVLLSIGNAFYGFSVLMSILEIKFLSLFDKIGSVIIGYSFIGRRIQDGDINSYIIALFIGFIILMLVVML